MSDFDSSRPRTREELFLEKLMGSAQGSPIFLTTRSSNPDLPNFSFAKHFNQDLTVNSDYFRALKDFMGCVHQHANSGLSKEQEETVCAKEFKNLRLAAF